MTCDDDSVGLASATFKTRADATEPRPGQDLPSRALQPPTRREIDRATAIRCLRRACDQRTSTSQAPAVRSAALLISAITGPDACWRAGRA